MDLAVGFVNTPLDEVDRAVGAALASTGRATGVDRAYLFRYDFHAGVMVNTHEWCAPGVQPVIDDLQAVPVELLPAWVEAHRRGEAIHIPSVTALADGDPLKEVLAAQGVETLVTVPLMADARCLGFVGFDVVGAGKDWSAHERDLLRVLAELFTNAEVRRERERSMVQARRDAEIAEERLALALSASRDAIWDHDLRAGTVRLSDRWWQMLGRDGGVTEASPAVVDALIHPDDRSATRRAYRAAIDGSGDTAELRFRLRHRDGHHIPVVSRARILRDAGGRALRLVGSNLDVTEQHRYERTLVDAKHAAEAASEAKSRFISLVSHELRTPMTGVLGMVELLLAEPLEDRTRGYALAAQSSAQALLDLLDDLLDVAKIEAGRLEITSHPVDLRRLAREVVDLLTPGLGDGDVRIVLDVDAQVPSRVHADGARLRQVLLNLLGNAVKFTEVGTITLGVEVRGEPAPGRIGLRLAVADTGIGIAPEVLPRLFTPFTQADDTTSRRYGGTGLGLAIVRQLVELMGGRVEVTSSPGRGSCFTVELEVDRAHDAADEPGSPAEPPREPSPDAHGLVVLVVEDHPVNQALACAFLDDLGADVRLVDDGAAGVREGLVADVDLILMDCFMPGMDGLEATRRIRAAEPAGRRVPILALTADASPRHAGVCSAAGMDAVVTKPYSQEELAAAVARWAPVGRSGGVAPEKRGGRT